MCQDTLSIKNTLCPVRLKQICPHINHHFIALDYNSTLLILDSNFRVKKYGPKIEYINLNDYQSPLQLTALGNNNTIIYLDQNLSINRTVNLPDNTYLNFVSPTRNSSLWINYNQLITLYDPHFKIINKQIDDYKTLNSIKKISSSGDTLFIFENNKSYKLINNEKFNTKNVIIGAYNNNRTTTKYSEHYLYTNNISYYIPIETTFIHSTSTHYLLLDKIGELYKAKRSLIENN